MQWKEQDHALNNNKSDHTVMYSLVIIERQRHQVLQTLTETCGKHYIFNGNHCGTGPTLTY